MTAEEILKQYFETGGNPDLMRIRVINLINAAINLLEQFVDDAVKVEPTRLFEISELLKVSMETINSEPVQVLFDNIASYRDHE